MTSFVIWVLLAFVAFSTTNSQVKSENKDAPTVSITFNYRVDHPITLDDSFFMPGGIISYLKWFGDECFKRYYGIVVLHFLGKNIAVATTRFAKSRTEFENVGNSIIETISYSFGGFNKTLNESRIWNLTPTDVRNWDKSNLLDPAAHAPVMYVYVDVANQSWSLTESWTTWEDRALKFNAQGFDVGITFGSYAFTIESMVQSLVVSKKLGVVLQNRHRGSASQVWYKLFELVETARTNCTKDISTDECYFVSNGTCAAGKREPGNYCFYPECPQTKCDQVCKVAGQKECSARCGSGSKTREPVHKFRHCPVERVDCGAEPCPTDRPGPRYSPKKPAVKDPDVLTTGSSGPHKVRIWQALWQWFGVVLAGRMWQW